MAELRFKKKILGTVVEIDYYDHNQTFNARVAGERYAADRMADLAKQLERAIRKSRVKVEVPVTLLHRPGWGKPSVEHVVLTGIHAWTGNLLFQNASGKRDQLTVRTAIVARRLTDDEAAHWLLLRKEASRLDDAVEKFEDAVRIKGEDAVTEAVAQKPDDPNETDAPVEEDADPRL